MHTGSFPAKIVKTTTRYPYSHVAISFDRNCKTLYSFGRKRLNNFLVGGFVKQKSTDSFFKKFRFSQCRVFELAVTDEQYRNLQDLLNAFEANADKFHYDFCGLMLRTLLHTPITFTNHYVCSHFVAQALSDTGVYDFTYNPCMAKPRDFETMRGANEIYCGAYPIRQPKVENDECLAH